MVVDDDPDTVSILARHLQREGFVAIEAISGAECVRIAQERPVDVILLDLMMPDMDGWEVYQNMKAGDVTKSIPVIVVTAKAQSIDKVLGLHIAKVDDYITKPFGPQELLESVEKVLGRQTQGQNA
jgi:DNA-binding response OmpR family regulator